MAPLFTPESSADILDTLQRLGLVSIANKHVTVHQVVQRAVRALFEEETDSLRLLELLEPVQQCIQTEFAAADISKRTGDLAHQPLPPAPSQRLPRGRGLTRVPAPYAANARTLGPPQSSIRIRSSNSRKHCTIGWTWSCLSPRRACSATTTTWSVPSAAAPQRAAWADVDGVGPGTM